MAVSRTATQRFPHDIVPGDSTNPWWWNVPGDKLENICANLFQDMLGVGVVSGFTIANDKTVGAGSCYIDGYKFTTASGTAITGLTNSAVNYVNAQPNITEDDTVHGNITFGVNFVATTSATKLANACRVGQLELDGDGDVVADSISHATQDKIYRLHWREFVVTVTAADCVPGTAYEVDVTFGETLYSGVTLDYTEGANWTVNPMGSKPTLAVLRIVNDGLYTATWSEDVTVRGISGQDPV